MVLQLVATGAAAWAAFSARKSAATSEAAILQTERITAEERVRTQRYMVQSRLQRLNALAAGLEGELKEMRRVPPSEVAGPRDMEHFGPWVAQLLYPDDELPACRNLTLSRYLTVRDLDVAFEEVLPLTRQLQEQGR